MKVTPKLYIFQFLILLLLIIPFLGFTPNAYTKFHESPPQYNTNYKKPGANIILITICSLRADHLGSYGYRRNTTPNIDQLTKEGIIFENAISQAVFTNPSIYSMLTSRNKSYHEPDDHTGIIRFSSIPEILRENDYQTGAIIAQSSISYLKSQFGYFDSIDVDRWTTHARKVTEKAIEWVKDNTEWE